MNKHATHARAGFTLIELITVVVIIGILAGILLPIITRSKDRAHELAAKELCAQVAAAWTTLALNNHRFPSQALLAKYGKADFKTSGGDLTFGMDPGISSVLNWWSAKGPVPEGDVRLFKPTYTLGPKKGSEIKEFDGSDPRLVQYWPVDQLLERSLPMKCYGVCAPWTEKVFKERMENLLRNESPDESGTVPPSPGSLVHAIIDYDADGKVTLPEDIAAAAGLPADQRDLPMTAAAWVSTDPTKGRVRLLTSW